MIEGKVCYCITRGLEPKESHSHLALYQEQEKWTMEVKRIMNDHENHINQGQGQQHGSLFRNTAAVLSAVKGKDQVMSKGSC